MGYQRGAGHDGEQGFAMMIVMVSDGTDGRGGGGRHHWPEGRLSSSPPASPALSRSCL